MAGNPHSWSQDGANPLLSDSPAVWDRLIESIGPASLLVVIESRMSAALRRRLTPEDIWQETLLHVWRDRGQCAWRGLKAFRSWVLSVIDNRIRDADDHECALKRGGGRGPVFFSALEPRPGDGPTSTPFPGPTGSTTPSRVAIHREQAAAMRAALETVPAELREVVRLRLFEQLTVEEVAERLALGPSAVRHRFRQGAALYQSRLLTELATRSQTSAENAGAPRANSSPSE